jgi:hypothetical protein
VDAFVSDAIISAADDGISIDDNSNDGNTAASVTLKGMMLANGASDGPEIPQGI